VGNIVRNTGEAELLWYSKPLRAKTGFW